jgi:hypothetical protein
MINRIFFIFLVSLLSIQYTLASASSYTNATFQNDTSAYQTQRLKINALLAERSTKFGQYDESLNTRTGIFGFQTKRDIKNSNEILRQIVLNDNNIFKELKILMDYKDLEVRQVQETIVTTSSRTESYKQAIKKLQDQNELLREELKKQEGNSGFMTYLVLFILTIAVATSYLFTKKFRLTKR